MGLIIWLSLTLQVAFLKDTILKKDGEIERLQMLVDHKTGSHVARDEKYSVLKHSASSTFIPSLGGTSTRDAHLSDSMTVFTDNVASYFEDLSQFSENHCAINGGDKVQNLQSGADPLGFRDTCLEDRLSDISDSARSVGRESDDSVSCSTDFVVFPHSSKPADMTAGRMYVS